MTLEVQPRVFLDAGTCPGLVTHPAPATYTPGSFGPGWGAVLGQLVGSRAAGFLILGGCQMKA